MLFPMETMDLIYDSLLDFNGQNCRARWAMLCTCRLVYSAFHPKLWKDIVLTNSSLYKFVSIKTLRNPMLVRSLTLRLSRDSTMVLGPDHVPEPPQEGQWMSDIREQWWSEAMPYRYQCARNGLATFHQALCFLPKKIRRLRKLRAFSLYVDTEPFKDEVIDFHISRERILDLLKALQPSVKAVEIDTCGFDDCITSNGSTWNRTCMCYILVHYAENWDILRISMRAVCKNFFVSSKKLRQLSIILVSRQQTVSPVCNHGQFGERVQLAALDSDNAQRISDMTRDLIDRADFMTSNTRPEIAYPKLESFEIIQVKSFTDFSEITPSFVKHDVLTHQSQTVTGTCSYTIMPGDKASDNTLHDENISGAERTQYVDTNNFEDVLHLAESHAWVQDKHGSRLPRGYRETLSSKNTRL